MRPSRRAVLLAAGGLLAACGSDGPTAGSSQSGHFTSRYRGGARTGWTILYPPGHTTARSRRALPLLAAHGLDTRRPGFIGWSMGGYGALYLATVLGAERCGVAVSASAAIWHRADQVVEGSFDDAADFRSHALWSRLPRLAGIPLRIDCGASDGFAPVVRHLRARLHPTPAGGIQPGAHDSSYWRRMAPAELAFAAAHL